MSTELIRADIQHLVASEPAFASIDPDAVAVEVWGPGFGPLVHLILGQQVSIEAADAMYRKLEAVTGSVTPSALLALDDDTMRACGFTRMKAEYARGVASAALEGFSIERLTDLPDAEVIDSLMTLRGIGPWTAECYLLFCLGRRDLFPTGDLALRVGLQELLDLDAQPSEPETAQLAARWSPHRTAAAFLVWQGYLERRGRAGNVPFH